jgi:DNA adenine methylase
MEVYRVVRSHPKLLARHVAALGGPENYYAVRDKSPDDASSLARAARFIYLNRFCFNGVYRTNRSGAFNVPRGIKTGRVPSELEFYRAAMALRSADIVDGDFERSLQDIRRGDFVYLDPPYGSSTRECYGEYGYDCFNAADLDRLAACLRRIDDAGGLFLLSFRLTDDLLRRVKPFHVVHLQVRRHVAGFARARALASEVLVRNYDGNR